MQLRDAILETLEVVTDIGGAFFKGPYLETRLSRALFATLFPKASQLSHRRYLSVALSRLRREGLVRRVGSPRYARWHLTPLGKDYLAKRPPPTQVQRPRQESKQPLRLVIFDIPEQQRRKRNLVRHVLTVAGYRQLQKSVWMAREPLPADFIEMIDRLGLSECVPIFSVWEK